MWLLTTREPIDNAEVRTSSILRLLLGGGVRVMPYRSLCSLPVLGRMGIKGLLPCWRVGIIFILDISIYTFSYVYLFVTHLPQPVDVDT